MVLSIWGWVLGCVLAHLSEFHSPPSSPSINDPPTLPLFFHFIHLSLAHRDIPNPEVPSEAFPQTAASIHARAICNYLLEIPNLHEDVVSASEWAGVKQLND